MIKVIKFIIISLSITNILYGAIDISKNAIVIKNVLTLKKVYKLAKQLDNYDVFIYKVEKIKKPFYVINTVNLDTRNIHSVLKDSKKISNYAYITSPAMVSFLAQNTYQYSIFLKKHSNKEKINYKKRIKKYFLTKQKEKTKIIVKKHLHPIQKKKIKPKVINVNKNKKIKKVNKEKVKKVESKKSSYFLGGYLGGTHISTTQKNINGSITLGNQPDTKGFNFGWELGYGYTNDTFSTVSYSRSNLDDIEFYNYLLSYNKSFQNILLKPYIGILGGLGYAKITKSLLNGSTVDNTGKSLVYGLQIGIEKKINENFRFFSQYQILNMKYTTKLEAIPARGELIRKNQMNMMFGIRWKY